MDFIPYSCQDIDDSDIAAVTAVLRSAYLTQGPEGPAFEAAFAERHQVAHAVAVSNATAGLHLACLALGAGPGSRVWTSPNSFLASANAPLYCGATVDFVDIERDTRNLSVAALALKLERARAAGTLPQLVIPVDFAGLPCDWRELRALADRYGFKLLQDASHATGASYRGVPVGSAWADASVFSFHAVKIVTTAEGGMVTTHDAALAADLRLLRSHGMTREPAALQAVPEGPWVYEQRSLQAPDPAPRNSAPHRPGWRPPAQPCQWPRLSKPACRKPGCSWIQCSAGPMSRCNYSPSPNLASMRARRASIATASSGPSTSISTSEPKPAASIITPMMLLALTRRLLRLRWISLLKLPASFVSLAEARA